MVEVLACRLGRPLSHRVTLDTSLVHVRGIIDRTQVERSSAEAATIRSDRSLVQQGRNQVRRFTAAIGQRRYVNHRVH